MKDILEGKVETVELPVEEDSIFNFLDCDFASTPRELLGKKIIYFNGGPFNLRIYIVDDDAKSYFALPPWGVQDPEAGLSKLRERMQGAKGVEISITKEEPRFGDYKQLAELIVKS